MMRMLKQISAWIDAISSTWLMIISLLVMAGFLGLVLPAQAARSISDIGSARSPDTSFFYTPDELYQIAEEYGESGRQAYIKTRWTFDLVFPLVYTIFLAVGISWFNHRIVGWGAVWKLTNLMPVLGGFLDVLENTATSVAMASFPARLSGILWVASLITPVKWVFVSGSFLPYFLSGSAWLFQRIQGKQS